MTISAKPPLITILGPTASGKTHLGVELCKSFDGEIISADSRQVYTGMDIGTGKDLDEYGAIKYHLIDVISPRDEYNLFKFAQDFCSAFQHVNTKRKLAFLVGGTGMYLDAVISRYNLTIANKDENARHFLEKKSERELRQILCAFNNDLHNTTDLTNKERIIRAIEISSAEQNNKPVLVWPEFNELIIGIDIPRDVLKKRITLRLKNRLNQGMIEEVEKLNSDGIEWKKLHFFGLEYRFIAQYLQGELNYNDMFQKLNAAIWKFSKQQTKWFKNFEKKGVQINWLPADGNIVESAKHLISDHLNEHV